MGNSCVFSQQEQGCTNTHMPHEPAHFGINFKFCYITLMFYSAFTAWIVRAFFKWLKQCRGDLCLHFPVWNECPSICLCVLWIERLLPHCNTQGPTCSMQGLSTEVNMNFSSWTTRHNGYHWLLPDDLWSLLTWCTFKGITWLHHTEPEWYANGVSVWAWEKKSLMHIGESASAEQCF